MWRLDDNSHSLRLRCVHATVTNRNIEDILRTQILLQKAELSIKRGTGMTDHTPRGVTALC